jgi:hypothetical protein
MMGMRMKVAGEDIHAEMIAACLEGWWRWR